MTQWKCACHRLPTGFGRRTADRLSVSCSPEHAGRIQHAIRRGRGRQRNVYVADFRSNVFEIQAVDGSIPPSPTITTLGSGFNGLLGVAVDGSGNVYVADSGNSAVKEILAVNAAFLPRQPSRSWQRIQ